jgi:hypothetical protein
VVGRDLLSYLREDPELALVAHTPLLSGGYVRDDKPLAADFDHAGTPVRLATLRDVAKETGALPWVPSAIAVVLPVRVCGSGHSMR